MEQDLDISKEDSDREEEKREIWVQGATRFYKQKQRERYLSVVNDFIGGFEQWSKLNEDCQRHVIKYMDYKSRCHLGMCSKHNYEIVNKVPLHVYGIELVEQNKSDGYESTQIKVVIELEKDANQKFELYFQQYSENTTVRWTKYTENLIPRQHKLTIGNSFYYDEAVNLVEKWMKNCSYGVTKLVVGMEKYPIETSSIKSLPNLKRLVMMIQNEKKIKLWFNKFPEHLDDVQFINFSNAEKNRVISSEILSMPQIMNSKKLYFSCRVNLTSDIFFKLSAKRFSFHSELITEKDINQFIKNWMNGKCTESFKEAVLWARNVRNSEQITEGIEKIAWNNTFQREHEEFWSSFSEYCTTGECYQVLSKINPLISITLNITERTVSIYVTGKARKLNGTAYTRYRIP